jgi:hypothetical protein
MFMAPVTRTTHAQVLLDGTMPMQRIVNPNTTREEGDRIKRELTSMISRGGGSSEPGDKGDGVAWSSDEGIFPVRSCFGGLAVYDAFAYYLEGCRYSGGRRGDRYSVTTYVLIAHVRLASVIDGYGDVHA